MNSLFHLVLSLLFLKLSDATPVDYGTTQAAGGNPPDNYLPSSISTRAIKELQQTLFLENLEAYYFQTGLQNITSWGPQGYSNDTLSNLNRIMAQEKVHIRTLENILEAYDADLVPPCQYSFPVTSVAQFFHFSAIITSVGTSAIIGLSERLARSDPLLARSVSSIVTVESRHDTMLRSINGRLPNPAPFDTGISSIWAYNLVLPFVKPGSCAVEIPQPILPPLHSQYDGFLSQNESQIIFSWDPSHFPFDLEAGREFSIGWLNQVNDPIYTSLNLTGPGQGTAEIPGGLNGAVFAALTTQTPANAEDFGLATLAGPVVLLVN